MSNFHKEKSRSPLLNSLKFILGWVGGFFIPLIVIGFIVAFVTVIYAVIFINGRPANGDFILNLFIGIVVPFGTLSLWVASQKYLLRAFTGRTINGWVLANILALIAGAIWFSVGILLISSNPELRTSSLWFLYFPLIAPPILLLFGAQAWVLSRMSDDTNPSHFLTYVVVLIIPTPFLFVSLGQENAMVTLSGLVLLLIVQARLLIWILRPMRAKG